MQIAELVDYLDNWDENNNSYYDYVHMNDIKELMLYRDWEWCREIKLDISVGVGYMAIHKGK